MRRLAIRRDVEGKNRLGNIIISTTIGRPISVGVMKEVNRFSFIWFLRGLSVFVVGLLWPQGLKSSNNLKILIGK